MYLHPLEINGANAQLSAQVPLISKGHKMHLAFFGVTSNQFKLIRSVFRSLQMLRKGNLTSRYGGRGEQRKAKTVC